MQLTGEVHQTEHTNEFGTKDADWSMFYVNIGVCSEMYLWQHLNKSSALLSQSIHQSCLNLIHLLLLLCRFCALFRILQGHKLGQGHLVNCPNSFISSIYDSLYSWTLQSAEADQQRLCPFVIDVLGRKQALTL